MKNILKIFIKKPQTTTVNQKILLEFVDDTENIKKAARGSMEKRLKVIEQAANTQGALL